MNTFIKPATAIIMALGGVSAYAASPPPLVTVKCPVVPVLSGMTHSPTDRLTVISSGDHPAISGITLDFSGSTDISDIIMAGVCTIADSTVQKLPAYSASAPTEGKATLKIDMEIPLPADTTYLWIALTLRDSIDLSHKISVKCTSLTFGNDKIITPDYSPMMRRTGVALRQSGQDNITSCRIPGIATASDGTLLAIYDARHESSRDLQGDIDIALQRSTDGGSTWTPMHTILDMGTWGGLPERYNGVSDACILTDNTTGRIFVAGLWMHGALDADGKWIDGLDENSNYWIHQWKGRGSQPGTGIKETCQFLITNSDDGGLTWSFPHNITSGTKRPEWWLYAPAPGQGICLNDGTLVFPTQGRDSEGIPFSNITYSTDHGKTWIASNPAYGNVTECNAVQLQSGDIMLNMRDNRNRGHINPNGRRICTTPDLGTTWKEHPTSRNALIEPTCMASLHRHNYTDTSGKRSSILLFANPPHHKKRKDLTLKASFDDGMTWPEAYHIMFDESKGFGYSSITSVDNNSIGILYESGLTDIVFIKIDLNEILNP